MLPPPDFDHDSERLNRRGTDNAVSDKVSPHNNLKLQPPAENTSVDTSRTEETHETAQKQQIFIEVAPNIAIPLLINLSTATAGSIFEQIDKWFVDGRSKDAFFFYFNGKVMESRKLLSEYNLEPGSALLLEKNVEVMLCAARFGTFESELGRDSSRVVGGERIGTFDDWPPREPSMMKKFLTCSFPRLT
ncbi:uncharacterized protein QC763_511502 [Podospora pseudopauciseta]|uniref:Ubiquitin-like domain-containing protein n=1 Tax=Podospora pseudopauciseta TaxID=2093780 RepID=A0ABR0HB38_9PEZI|nr:hypothetical protein QC763_511502 [Podospora pseudopauciseta]